MLRYVFMLCVMMHAALANLAGTTVHSGDCVCVSGSGVHARNRAGTTGTTVVGTYNTGTCFKTSGGVLTKDGYTWYEVNDGSTRMWIAGNFLTKGSASQCAAGTCSAEQKRLACELAASANIVAAQRHPSGVHDNAYSYNNIHDMCNGYMAHRSHYTCTECRIPPGAPGGQTCLSLNLLKYLVELKNHGRVIINELAGACHSCKSRHYSGLAVDLHNDARSQEYIDKCNAMGGLGIDEHNHIHCQFYDGPHPNW